jgi:hypothetical protein
MRLTVKIHRNTREQREMPELRVVLESRMSGAQ